MTSGDKNKRAILGSAGAKQTKKGQIASIYLLPTLLPEYLLSALSYPARVGMISIESFSETPPGREEEMDKGRDLSHPLIIL